MANAEDLAELKKILRSTLTSDGTIGAKKAAFFRDAFVDGYVFGTVGEYARLRGLADQQRSELMAAIDETVTPPRGLFSFGSPGPHPRETYRKEGNADWTKGVENAARYVQWIMDVEGIEQDTHIRSIIDLLYRKSELAAAPDVLKFYYKANGGVFAGQSDGFLEIALAKRTLPDDPAARAFCEKIDQQAVKTDEIFRGEGIFWGNFAGMTDKILSGPHEQPRREALELVRSAVAAYRAAGHALDGRPVTRNDVADMLHTQQFFDVANARFGRKLIRQ